MKAYSTIKLLASYVYNKTEHVERLQNKTSVISSIKPLKQNIKNAKKAAIKYNFFSADLYRN